MPRTQHVAIIGAGPAGCVAAILLARGGLSVSLIEQHRFPRRKVCGECLSAVGHDVLAAMNATDLLRKTSATRFDFARVHTNEQSSSRMPLPRPMWGISRERLDSSLLDIAAHEPNISIFQPARCESIDDDRVLTIRRLADNSIEHRATDLLMVADGGGTLFPTPRRLTGRFGIKAHFTGVARTPTDCIELFSTPGSYGGIAAIEGDRWNISFSVKAELLRRHGGNIDQVFAEVTSQNLQLRRRLRDAQRQGAWLTSPLPLKSVTDKWPTGVVPVGNAAAAIEPIGGEGMGLAMRSSQVAATAIIAAVNAGRPYDLTSLQREYRALWNKRALACRAAGFAAMRPTLVNLLLPLIEPSTWPAKPFIAAMGKRSLSA